MANKFYIADMHFGHAKKNSSLRMKPDYKKAEELLIFINEYTVKDYRDQILEDKEK